MTFSPQWNLSNISLVTRSVSGQIDANQFTDSQVEFYVNSYYQYDLPRELKIEELYTQYTFMTLPNLGVYTLPGNFSDGTAFTHVEPKLYVNGQPIFYTQDTNQFYHWTPRLFAVETIGYGDGVTTVFNYATNQIPIVPNQKSSVMITELAPRGSGMTSVESFYDEGDGTQANGFIGTLTSTLLVGGGSGTIAYQSYPFAGNTNIQVTFATAPVLNQQIEVTYHFEQLGIPTSVLFYDRQFNFYPVPDTTYQIRIDAYFQPAQLVNPSDIPVKQEWGEIIAMGAALKILRNLGQYDKYKEVEQYYLIERSKVMSDTDNQYMAMRAPPTC